MSRIRTRLKDNGHDAIYSVGNYAIGTIPRTLKERARRNKSQRDNGVTISNTFIHSAGEEHLKTFDKYPYPSLHTTYRS